MKPWLSVGAGLAVGLAAIVGCSKSTPPLVEATGVVLLDGKPLPRASIMLYPTFAGHGSELFAVGTSDDEGKFALECGVGPGACVGAYKAVIAEAPVPPELMRYTPDSSAKITQYYSKLPNRPIPGLAGDVASTPVTIEILPGKRRTKSA